MQELERAMDASSSIRQRPQFWASRKKNLIGVSRDKTSGTMGFALMRTMCSSIDVYGFSIGGLDIEGPYHYFDSVVPDDRDIGRWLPQETLLRITAMCSRESNPSTIRMGTRNISKDSAANGLSTSLWTSICAYNGLQSI